jgi:hypothetical protein
MSITLPEETLSENPAVAACMCAWNDDYLISKNSGMKEHDCKNNARAAYRAAMPDLNDAESILNFIACVGRGILLEVFNDYDTKKLLAAAQAARQSDSAVRRQLREEAALRKPPAGATVREENIFSEIHENME